MNVSPPTGMSKNSGLFTLNPLTIKQVQLQLQVKMVLW